MDRRAFVLGAPLALAACGAPTVWAPDDRVAEATYRHDGPSAITLYTVFNVGSDRGAHTGLLINGSQRVLFDPAGTFQHSKVVERNDVIFGLTNSLWSVYVDYHTRVTFYSRTQYLQVPPETAEFLLRAAMAEGPVPKAMCSRTTSAMLARAPGFSQIRTVWYPDKLFAQFARIPGVQTQEFRDDDNPQRTGFWDDRDL